jgi:hypothetical protein
MARFKLESFREEIKKYLLDNYEDFCEWLVEEGGNVRKGVDEERRRECICYGVFFHLPSDLKRRMHNASEWQDEPIANIMISVIKGIGVYNNIK